MRQSNCDAAFIIVDDTTEQAGHRFGIVTRTDLLHAVMLDNRAPSTAVGQIATSPVISIELGAYL
ncbi:CBS domain-containing protein, partial [Photobacterium sp. R1]